MKADTSEKILVETLFNESSETKENSRAITKLTGDASTRRYYRVSTSNDSYVVCLDEPKKMEEDHDFVQIQKILSHHKIRVPRIIDFNVKKGFMIQEDLGDQTYLKHLGQTFGKGSVFDEFKKIIDLLIGMQSIDVSSHSSESFANRYFDFNKLSSEMEFTKKYFIESYLGVPAKSSRDNLFSFLCKKMAKEKKVFTHRDYHSRNIMRKNSENIVIDFQDARMGIPHYDLVSMLEDCYFSLSAENVDKLKKYYFDKFISPNKMNSSYEEFLYFYDMALIQRIYKAIGSFCYIYHHRKDSRYLKYIGYSFEKVRNTMMKYEELKSECLYLSEVYYQH